MSVDTDITNNPVQIQNMINTTGDFTVPGFIYGYRNISEGPTEGFFQNCLKYIQTNKVDVTLADGTIIKNRKRPMLIIFGENDSRRLSDLAHGINYAVSSIGPALKRDGMLNLQFILKPDKSGPKECLTALNFIKQKTGIEEIGKSFIMTYGEFEDGTIYMKYGNLIKDDSENRTDALLNVFGTGLNGSKQGLAYTWQKEWDELYDKHKSKQEDIQLYDLPQENPDKQVNYNIGFKYNFGDIRINWDKIKNNTNSILCLSAGTTGVWYGCDFSSYPISENPNDDMNKKFPGSFKIIKEWHELTNRPMFLVYGKPYHNGTNRIAQECTMWDTFHSMIFSRMYACRTEINKDDTSITYRGFLPCFYKGDSSLSEAKEIEDFIRQYEDEYGKIKGSYPIYMVYGKKHDGSLYVRYGGLNTKDFEDDTEHTGDPDKLKEQMYDLNRYLNQFGKEIGYVYTEHSTIIEITSNTQLQQCINDYTVNQVPYLFLYSPYEESTAAKESVQRVESYIASDEFDNYIKIKNIKAARISLNLIFNNSEIKNTLKNNNISDFGSMRTSEHNYYYISLYDSFRLLNSADTLQQLKSTKNTKNVTTTCEEEIYNIIKQYTFDLNKNQLKNTDIYAVLCARNYPADKNDKLYRIEEDPTRLETLLVNSGVPKSNIIKLRNEQETLSNIKKYLDEGIKHDLLIFSFSGHGGSDGHMVAYDGNLTRDVLIDKFKNAKNNVFCIINTCYPEKVIEKSFIDEKFKSGSIKNFIGWASATKSQSTVNLGLNKGHSFTFRVIESHDKTKIYGDLWEYLKIQRLYIENGKNYQNNPVKVVYGTDFSNKLAFTNDDRSSETYFTVTFISDGELYDSQSVKEGESAKDPGDPYKEGYTFKKWEPDYTNVHSDLTCTAQFEIKKYSVIFKDYDGTVLKDTQQVEYMQPAIPPEKDPPKRTGYEFDGYKPDYNEVKQNLTCIAQYIDVSIKKQVKKETFMDCSNLEKIDFKNKISSIDSSAFYNCKSLKSISNVDAAISVGDCAFYNCYNIKSLDFGNEIRNIGTSAFSDCQNLTSINVLQNEDPNKAMNKVKDYAFANTGIKQAKLMLNSSVADTYWGDHCFENCKSLESVQFLKSMYQSNYMFKDCSNLKTVVFPDDQPCNYVGKYVFDGCTSLQNITFTKSQYSFLKGYFNNCTNLKKVNFKTYDDCQFNLVQKYAFANCKNLTSIEFPASLVSLNELEDGCLSGCSSLNTLKFHGISSNGIFERVADQDYYYGKTYTFTNNQKYSNKSEIDRFDRLYNLLSSNNIPFTLIVNRGIYNEWNICTYADITYLSELGLAYPVKDDQQYWGNIYPCLGSEWPNDQFKTYKSIMIFITDFIIYDEDEVRYPIRQYSKEEIENAKKNVKKNRTGSESQLKNTDLIVHLHNKGILPKNKNIYFESNNFCYKFTKYTAKGIPTSDSIKYDIGNNDDMYSFFNTKPALDYKISENDIILCIIKDKIVDQTIIQNGLFRARRNCNITFANNDTFTYRYDSTKEVKFEDKYEYPSDKSARSNFKVASAFGYKAGEEKSVWYYNAKEIKAYADEHHIPVLIIYSSETCTPCQQYLKNIHMNSSFQDWAKKQNFLMCRIETDKTKDADEEYRYCMEDLRNSAQNYDASGKGNVKSFNAFDDTTGQSKLIDGWYSSYYMPPAMTFYYKREDGTEVANHLYSFHSWFNALYKYDKVSPENTMQMIKSLCLYHFDNNKLEGAKYVVDALKEFNKYDYDINIENPFQIAENAIEPAIVYPEITSLDAIKANITAQQQLTTHVYKNGDYMNGCYFEAVDWINLTYNNEAFSSTTYDEKTGNSDAKRTNEIFDEWFIKANKKYYKMQINPEEKKKVNDTCTMNPYIYKVIFNEVEYKPPVKMEYKVQITMDGTLTYHAGFNKSNISQTLNIKVENPYEINIEIDSIDNYLGIKPTAKVIGYDSIEVTIPANTIPSTGNTIFIKCHTDC